MPSLSMADIITWVFIFRQKWLYSSPVLFTKGQACSDSFSGRLCTAGSSAWFTMLIRTNMEMGPDHREKWVFMDLKVIWNEQ